MQTIMYLHATSLAFYSTATHGPRTLQVPDPDWEPVPDTEAAESPLIEVVNPDCQLPPASELIELSASQYEQLVNAPSLGKVLAVENGKPVLVDPPAPSADRLAEAERNWRDYLLVETDPLIARHRDELELDATSTTLSTAQYRELLIYREALRDWPASSSFPLGEARPGWPAWLTQYVSALNA
ncbi:phage tail assembly chaperone [Pseudomonas nicosulfuronedens]|uniref:phage tail assembly chaperone n=1 Tax=Pseudomonas nicosulfuronedens TaxID=2571105 RepID=UPI00244925BF|nr:phage tail assembly chaperone [Pseudomonas nicosulfuronedens]MDH1007440.1 phage tail assembly chaperone [Pseudomonas nicosulfuronedens]MDH1977486.1 phage tail assembly chaperone [Pseudomonas nicosulfuronedens]MDH2028988.1 phage tail assembly chaperone [Pseudomonas nicosulfuronedens]